MMMMLWGKHDGVNYFRSRASSGAHVARLPSACWLQTDPRRNLFPESSGVRVLVVTTNNNITENILIILLLLVLYLKYYYIFVVIVIIIIGHHVYQPPYRHRRDNLGKTSR